MSTRIRNDLFDRTAGYALGRHVFVLAIWQIVKASIFMSSVPWPSALKRFLLRLFGARVGKGVVIKPRVNVHIPWKLSVGDYAWIGEEAFLLNLEPIHVGSHACISQRAFLCTGNHDYRDFAMRYRNAAINVEDGAWVGAQVFVGPGVTIGVDAVVAAGSVVTRNVKSNMVGRGNPCFPSASRWKY